MTKIAPPEALRQQKKRRVWAYKPYWPGRPEWVDEGFDWRDFSPITTGHDEYSRTTLCIGWAITGRVVIALGYCGEQECYDESVKWLDDDDDDDDDEED